MTDHRHIEAQEVRGRHLLTSFIDEDGRRSHSVTMTKLQAFVALFISIATIGGIGMGWATLALAPKWQADIKQAIREHTSDVRQEMSGVSERYVLRRDFDAYQQTTAAHTATQEARWLEIQRRLERIEALLERRR